MTAHSTAHSTARPTVRNGTGPPAAISDEALLELSRRKPMLGKTGVTTITAAWTDDRLAAPRIP
ncbi:hypothetical protein [Nonomuraea sp. NPDC049758]|uniref:hypothetical protein n=1 Tax=Nonomuraea sp. NPDC049758 TaxID=3154360 RepID=UPI00342A9F26